MRKARFRLVAPLRKSLVRSGTRCANVLILQVLHSARCHLQRRDGASGALRTGRRLRVAATLSGFRIRRRVRVSRWQIAPQIPSGCIGQLNPRILSTRIGFAPFLSHLSRSLHRMTSKESLTQKWLRQNAQPYLQADRVFTDIDATLARFSSLRPKTDVYSSVFEFLPYVFHLTCMSIQLMTMVVLSCYSASMVSCR